MPEQFNTLHEWLNRVAKVNYVKRQAIQGDASFRQYYRITTQTETFILMDARVEKHSCVSFVAIAEVLRQQGLITPKIYCADIQNGLLLLSDFGDSLFRQAVTDATANFYYSQALEALALLQATPKPAHFTVPVFTSALMDQELNDFKEWFLIKHYQLALTVQEEKELAQCFDWLIQEISQQPWVFMHRDFHSKNLMILNENVLGLLDFQDAFYGPLTYDLVSLLRDCYLQWPETLISKWMLAYKTKLRLPVSDDLFTRWFDLTGIQRHLKALLTFSRKYRRDHNSHYLHYIPTTINVIRRVASVYPQCGVLNTIMDKITLCEA